MNQNNRKICKECLRKHRFALVLFGICMLIQLMVFCLYQIQLEPFFYSLGILLVAVLAALLIDFGREKKRAELRFRCLSNLEESWNSLPQAESLAEEEYQQMISALGEQMEQMSMNLSRQEQEMVDYYTAWVHQIKTPISVMRMKLSAEDTPEHREVLAELFRIEQYVEMVLNYIRLGSRDNDLVIREYDVDDLVRSCIRKYASLFIQKKLSMDFQSGGCRIVTDQKWFCMILEQILSNAIKYTNKGGIRISIVQVNQQIQIRICDTGIGIAPEDIPRIFEKGFTGENGRVDKRSSGLGLYLCQKAARKLNINIQVASQPGDGTTFSLTV